MLIDTHCHLHDLEWFTPAQQTEFLDHAHRNGVQKIICIGTNPTDSRHACDFAASHEGVYWTYGIHPEFANQQAAGGATNGELLTSFATMELDFPNKGSAGDTIDPFERIRSHDEDEHTTTNGELLTSFSTMELDSSGGRGSESLDDESVPSVEKEAKGSPVAIGEIGLDYHYDGYDRVAQIRLFEQMLQLALDLQLPVSLHIREAFADAWGVIDNFPGTRGVVHSFTGSKRDLRRALDRGFYIGVNGLATYTTPALPPLENIVLETDAPFLTPVPFRGTINEPGYVRTIAQYLAEKLGVAETEIEERTTKNAGEVFQI